MTISIRSRWLTTCLMVSSSSKSPRITNLRTMVRSMSSHTSHHRESSVGFIGLGAMGSEMASNLLTKFQSRISSFVIHDASQSSISNFLERHVSALVDSDKPVKILTATSPASVARLASTIVTMLPSSAEVEEVYLNPDSGVLNGIQKADDRSGSALTPKVLCIDSTTLDLSLARAVAERIREGGGEMMDGPVSGGVVGAREGSLTFMCGGEQATFARAQPILDQMGRRSIYCGKSGSGLAAKLANNMLLAISMIGTAEAMILGQKLGLKAGLLAEIINSSTGRCWSSEINNPAPGALLPTRSTPADRNFQGGFTSRLMAKDLGLALDAVKAGTGWVEENGSLVEDFGESQFPIGKLVNQIYQKLAQHQEFSQRDFSVVYDWLRLKASR